MRQLFPWVMALVVFLFSYSSRSANESSALSARDKEKLIVEEIESNIKEEFKIDFTWSEQKQDSTVKPTPKPKKVEVKKITQGESRVAEMLRKQREKIAKMREADRNKHRDQVADAKSGGVAKDWLKQKSRSSQDWMQAKVDEQNAWTQKKMAVLKKWAQDKLQYKKELPQLKKDLTDLSDFTQETIEVTKSIAEVHTPKVDHYQVDLIREDFNLPIRSQGRRSTCSAFAAVRSMEILAQRKGRNWDLSEQFFYYASKPKCQSSPCSKKGSWPLPAFKYDIPLEQGCPYSPVEKSRNETQIPLSSSCRNGRAKVGQYSHAKTRNDIQQAIRSGYPVIGGFKLNDAFYNNTGHVFLKGEADALMISNKDKHAQGHALVLIGVMDLPKELWELQGKHCTLVANSWGQGWGLGGYACLSDAWFDQYRYQFPFLVVKDITLL